MADEASDADARTVTAALVIIGDEILSGRTQDANLSYIATWLGKLGIQMAEARVVPDRQEAIVEAVNALRAAHDYVFTTGGIGPTHDDITADAIAAAFGVEIHYHEEALALLQAHYEAGQLNEARLRMARIPVGATLIDNPVSKAPGFQIGNVFVLAGIPRINQAMLESLRNRLVGGPPLQSRAVAALLPEGEVADGLRTVQEHFPDVAIGSYPYYRNKSFGVTLVLRSTDPAHLEAAYGEVVALIRSCGAEPVIDP